MRKFHCLSLLLRRAPTIRKLSTANGKKSTIHHLCTHFDISEAKAEHLCLKHPVINKLTELNLESLINTLHDLGYQEQVLLEKPVLFSMLPVTLRFRYKVLKECGIENVSPSCLVSFLPILKQTKIVELKRSGQIPSLLNVENRLASYMTQWPTSLTTLINADTNETTLYTLRLKIIQRYLELMLDLTKDEFNRGLQTYPTIKHRPLEVINETLRILEAQIMIPPQKIKTNLYLVHADPDNLRNIINKFQSIGGIDIREVIRKYPKIATKNFSTLVEIRNVLKEHHITNEAQKRCFEIYTLGPSTIRKRLEKVKTIPEFQTFINHPRFLEIIYYKNTAIKRLMQLYNNNKKCLSLNILSGGSARYDIFEKLPGDRMGKGKDLIFCISQSLGSSYSKSDIRNNIKRHPYWINIPLIQVKFVYQKLSTEFSSRDIYRNCQILLYPWSKIRSILLLFNRKQQNRMDLFKEQFDIAKLNNSQKLSLVLYLLEKSHYFTGNGVWTEEKNENVELDKQQQVRNHNC